MKSAKHPRDGRTRKRKRRPFVKFTVVLFSLALLFILFTVFTFTEANHLIRQDVRPLEPYAGNAMPTFRATSFKSLDEFTNLSGWFFPATQKKARATVIFIHPFNSNRAPFGINTASLVRDFLDCGFNVLTFDQRHSGESGGIMSTFGYSEWQDVIAAMKFLNNYTGSPNCVLYGIGSGCTTALTTWNHLRDPGQEAPKVTHNSFLEQNLANLHFDRSAIKAMILDTPLPDSDEYIRHAIRQSDLLFKQLTSLSVPYAIRISASQSKLVKMTNEISSLPIPIHIIYQQHSGELGPDITNMVPAERQRVSPGITSLYESDATAYLGAFAHDPHTYCAHIRDFLQSMVP